MLNCSPAALLILNLISFILRKISHKCVIYCKYSSELIVGYHQIYSRLWNSKKRTYFIYDVRESFNFYSRLLLGMISDSWTNFKSALVCKKGWKLRVACSIVIQFLFGTEIGILSFPHFGSYEKMHYQTVLT